MFSLKQWAIYMGRNASSKQISLMAVYISKKSKFGANFWGANFASVLFKLLFASLRAVFIFIFVFVFASIFVFVFVYANWIVRNADCLQVRFGLFWAINPFWSWKHNCLAFLSTPYGCQKLSSFPKIKIYMTLKYANLSIWLLPATRCWPCCAW